MILGDICMTLTQGFKYRMSVFKAVCFLTGLTYVYSLDAMEIDIIMQTHNEFRRNFANGLYGSFAANMNKLDWSTDLQLQALLSLDCALAFTQPAGAFNTHTNVGVSADGNITNLIRSWMLERQHFIPQFKTCINIQHCKRFLTMVHARQRTIGCAFTDRCRVKNSRVNVLVCKYAGSEDAIVPFYKPGLPCTKCDGETPFCERGLCVPCTGTSAECDCRKTCNKHNIGAGSLNSTSCSCTCSYGMGPNCDEDCVNPEMYEDWDPCSEITQQDCLFDRAILEEMCPVQCACRRHPNAGVTQ
ncbi:C-type lectin domain family 18 member A-like [Mizuhopecten yessoensis]|uniref:C-type lectin domain family 18 member A n=1 Tax=Mizuhopecten yessoensis TaxID=6573 RepID=A0A210R5I2_MIZYE|nr:C-type lectin domain family 18 member A-like [Mizuhopecten yessoensis]OWF56235.1 C-type lectin domain family 18 member A [Mizuhopecten yessoensis]